MQIATHKPTLLENRRPIAPAYSHVEATLYHQDTHLRWAKHPNTTASRHLKGSLHCKGTQETNPYQEMRKPTQKPNTKVLSEPKKRDTI
jgi:hypothetical protein